MSVSHLSSFLFYLYVSASVQCKNCLAWDKSFLAIPTMPWFNRKKWFALRQQATKHHHNHGRWRRKCPPNTRWGRASPSASELSAWQPPCRVGHCATSSDLLHHGGMMCSGGDVNKVDKGQEKIILTACKLVHRTMMVVTVILWLPQGHTPGFWAYNNQLT